MTVKIRIVGSFSWNTKGEDLDTISLFNLIFHHSPHQKLYTRLSTVAFADYGLHPSIALCLEFFPFSRVPSGNLPPITSFPLVGPSTSLLYSMVCLSFSSLYQVTSLFLSTPPGSKLHEDKVSFTFVSPLSGTKYMFNKKYFNWPKIGNNEPFLSSKIRCLILSTSASIKITSL